MPPPLSSSAAGGGSAVGSKRDEPSEVPSVALELAEAPAAPALLEQVAAAPTFNWCFDASRFTRLEPFVELSPPRLRFHASGGGRAPADVPASTAMVLTKGLHVLIIDRRALERSASAAAAKVRAPPPLERREKPGFVQTGQIVTPAATSELWVDVPQGLAPPTGLTWRYYQWTCTKTGNQREDRTMQLVCVNPRGAVAARLELAAYNHSIYSAASGRDSRVHMLVTPSEGEPFRTTVPTALVEPGSAGWPQKAADCRPSTRRGQQVFYEARAMGWSPEDARGASDADAAYAAALDAARRNAAVPVHVALQLGSNEEAGKYADELRARMQCGGGGKKKKNSKKNSKRRR